MTLHGANELRARLHAIERTGQDVAQRWATEGERDVRAEIPRETGATAASVHGSADAGGGRITAAGAITYLMGGTRAHEERPSRRQVMKFQLGGRTIFTKRVLHPPTPAHPRIAQAAMNAVGSLSAALVRLWNGAA